MLLVNIHKHILLLLFIFISIYSTQAQVWSQKKCIDTAQLYNKSLQISKNNISISEQKVIEAKANLIPKITANADYKYFTNLPYQLLPLSTFNTSAPEGQFKEAQFGVPHNINANLQFSMPLFNAQINGALQTITIASELTELQYQKTAEQLYFDITNLYYNAQILHHQIAFIDSNIINTGRLLKNIQLLNEQLLAKGTDVSKVKLQLTQLKSQRESGINKYTQILNALKFAMGISLDRDVQIDPTIKYENINNNSVSTSVDILMIKAQNSVLSSELNTLKKSKLPTLNLIGMYGTSGFGYDKQPNNFLKFFPIGYAGIQLSIPLFNASATQPKIIQKKLELHNNELQFQLVNEQQVMLIENSKIQILTAQKSIETILDQINLATIIYNQALFQQKNSVASLSDVLIADTALRESQQTYLTAIIDYLKADLELKKLTRTISTTK